MLTSVLFYVSTSASLPLRYHPLYFYSTRLHTISVHLSLTLLRHHHVTITGYIYLSRHHHRHYYCDCLTSHLASVNSVSQSTVFFHLCLLRSSIFLLPIIRLYVCVLGPATITVKNIRFNMGLRRVVEVLISTNSLKTSNCCTETPN